MNNIHREKLNRLLQERRERIDSIRHFDQHFNMFIHEMLRRILEEVNMELQNMTNDNLKLFMGDPYNERPSRYYAMVQFIIGGNRNREFFLDSTKQFPALTFQGNEVNGKLIVSQKLMGDEQFVKVFETDIGLIDENRIADLFIEFIDKVYRL